MNLIKQARAKAEGVLADLGHSVLSLASGQKIPTTEGIATPKGDHQSTGM